MSIQCADFSSWFNIRQTKQQGVNFMNKWKWALKAKRYWVVMLLILGIGIIIIQNMISVDYIKNILTCVGTSLISASITIFLIKFDIMDMIQSSSMEKFGVIDICNGRDHIFENNDMRDLKAHNWEEFLRQSSDKTIDIIGISMYSFLVTKNILTVIYKIAKKYTIRIVFADPFSTEVRLQSEEENKPNKLKENIEWLSKKIIEEDKTQSIKVYYSKTLPKAFIVRSGSKMIITPYLLKGPFEEPTIVASNTGYADNTYYETYKNYIEKIIETAECLNTSPTVHR